MQQKPKETVDLLCSCICLAYLGHDITAAVIKKLIGKQQEVVKKNDRNNKNTMLIEDGEWVVWWRKVWLV